MQHGFSKCVFGQVFFYRATPCKCGICYSISEYLTVWHTGAIDMAKSNIKLFGVV